MTRRRGQISLSDALDGYLKRIDKGGGLAQARIVEAWPEFVGPDIARHTAGLHVREGELVVYVDSPVWATELTAMSSRLLEGLNASLGKASVRSIRFTVSRKVRDEKAREAREREDDAFYAADTVEPESLSEAEVEQVRRSTSAIKNPELREAVVRATIKDLELKRGLERRGTGQRP